MNVYGGAEDAFRAKPTHPDGSPTGATTHATATVPGVGFHPVHTPRVAAVLDLLDETIGSSAVAA